MSVCLSVSSKIPVDGATMRGGGVCFVLFILCVCISARIRDPYSILGIHRKADTQEIKKSYKKLAKEW